MTDRFQPVWRSERLWRRCLICHQGWGALRWAWLSPIILIMFYEASHSCTCSLPSHILLPRRSYPQPISWDLPSVCLSIASLSLIPRTLLPFCGCSSCWWSPGDSSPCICVCLVLFLWKGVAAWLASIPGIPWTLFPDAVPGYVAETPREKTWKGYPKRERPEGGTQMSERSKCVGEDWGLFFPGNDVSVALGSAFWPSLSPVCQAFFLPMKDSLSLQLHSFFPDASWM